MLTLNKTFEISFHSYKGSSWAGSCFRLSQIWLLFSPLPAWFTGEAIKNVVRFLDTFLVSFFKLFSKYLPKFFFPSQKPAKNLNNCLKVGRFYFLIPAVIFFNWLCTCMHSKQILNYFAVLENVFLYYLCYHYSYTQ